MPERLISQETTKKIEMGGVVAAILGLITGLAALEVGGIMTAGTAFVYDRYQGGKKK